MVVSFKDVLKLAGIVVIALCATFVCTFFINYYVDATAIADTVPAEAESLYKAQLATAKLSCALSGCCLAVIAFFMLAFYIKIYTDSHLKQLGILKAMGYSDKQIALRFSVFGLSVLIGGVIGCALGYAVTPLIYSQMTAEGVEIPVRFHIWIPLVLTLAPTAVYSAFSCGYALLVLKRPVGEMLKGVRPEKIRNKNRKESGKEKERPFLFETGIRTLASKKMTVFFVAFACFCFSAMVQMGVSMYDLETKAMGSMILVIGVVLAVTCLLMALTSLVNSNIKNIAMMKVFGYSLKECALSVFAGYVPFALLGFAIGTVYQFAILKVMIDAFFTDYGLSYSFNVTSFFVTLAVFIVFYTAVMLAFTFKINRVSVKEVMADS